MTLAPFVPKLKPLFFYRTRIKTADEKGQTISETGGRYNDPGFHLTKT
jgi:hypothetical protein